MVALGAAACTFVAVAGFAFWLARSAAPRPLDVRLRAMGGAAGGARPGDAPFARRVVAPAIEGIGARLALLLPATVARVIERRLVLAGQPMPASTFYALLVAGGALSGGGYVLLLMAATAGTPPPAALLPGAPIGLMGVLFPAAWLSSRARRRQKAVLRALPDALDLVTLCVEAGLALDGALHQVAGKQAGPLADEIRQMLREVGLGKPRRQALLDLADRTDSDDMRSFAMAVVQAEQMGTSLGRVLRTQAQHMRVRRRQRAEEEARRAPVKMVFPLVFCLMPSLFIFILGPIVVRISEFLSGT